MNWAKIIENIISGVGVAFVIAIPTMAAITYGAFMSHTEKIEYLENEIKKMEKIANRFAISDDGRIGIIVDDIRITTSVDPEESVNEIKEFRDNYTE